MASPFAACIVNFNSRPCVRGDFDMSIAELETIFQFTPLREGRLVIMNNKGGVGKFQFTPLREGRRWPES